MTRFAVRAEYLSRYEIHDVGGSSHRSDGLTAAALVLGMFVVGPFLTALYYRGYQARRQRGIPPPRWWGTDMAAFAEGGASLRKRKTEQAQ